MRRVGEGYGIKGVANLLISKGEYGICGFGTFDRFLLLFVLSSGERVGYLLKLM